MVAQKNIQYAGSPLPMSFTEKNYEQGINFVIIKGDKAEQIERINFDPPVKLWSLPFEPKSLNDIMREIDKLPDGEVTFHSPFLEIKVLLTEPEPSIRHHIEEALKGKSVKLACTTPHRLYMDENKSKAGISSDLKEIDPMEMAKIVFLSQYGNEMPENLKSLLQSVIREVQ
jgi:exonuclease SbcD